MRPTVLVVAERALACRLRDALAPRHEVTVCSDPERARALASMGCFEAILIHGTLPGVSDRPEARFIAAEPPSRLDLERMIAATIVVRAQRERESGDASLARLAYRELVALARSRVVRDYLLALMRANRGCVTRAARQADVERETLHRLLRRHHVDPREFRPS